MKIGIIVAMSKELALLLHNIQDESRVTVNNRNFYIGRIGNSTSSSAARHLRLPTPSGIHYAKCVAFRSIRS